LKIESKFGPANQRPRRLADKITAYNEIERDDSEEIRIADNSVKKN